MVLSSFSPIFPEEGGRIRSARSQIGAKMNSNDSNFNDPLTDPVRAARVLNDVGTEAGWQVRDVRSVDVVGERPDKRRTLRFRVTARRAGGNPTEAYWYATQYRGGEGERMLPSLRFLRSAAAPSLRSTRSAHPVPLPAAPTAPRSGGGTPPRRWSRWMTWSGTFSIPGSSPESRID
jgi:hypothetical protein